MNTIRRKSLSLSFAHGIFGGLLSFSLLILIDTIARLFEGSITPLVELIFILSLFALAVSIVSLLGFILVEWSPQA